MRCELVLMTYLILHPRRYMRLAVAWIDGTRLHFVKILTCGDVNTFFALPERPEKLIIRITIITILLLCIFEPGCSLFLYFWIHYLFLIWSEYENLLYWWTDLTDGKAHAIIRQVKIQAYPLTQCLFIHMESTFFQFCLQPNIVLKEPRPPFRGAFSICCPPICSEQCVQL